MTEWKDQAHPHATPGISARHPRPAPRYLLDFSTKKLYIHPIGALTHEQLFNKIAPGR